MSRIVFFWDRNDKNAISDECGTVVKYVGLDISGWGEVQSTFNTVLIKSESLTDHDQGQLQSSKRIVFTSSYDWGSSTLKVHLFWQIGAQLKIASPDIGLVGGLVYTVQAAIAKEGFYKSNLYLFYSLPTIFFLLFLYNKVLLLKEIHCFASNGLLFL